MDEEIEDCSHDNLGEGFTEEFYENNNDQTPEYGGKFVTVYMRQCACGEFVEYDKTDEVQEISIFDLPVQDQRCPDYNEDCYKVPDPFCCWVDCHDKFEGGQARGYCPLIHGVK